MDLVNQTPLPAKLQVAPVEGERRAGALVVKATFRVASGLAELELNDPLPILAQDTPTELGILPNDMMVPGPTGELEVVVLAAAYSTPGDRTRASVDLSIGDLSRSLEVFGDRRWIGEGDEAGISDPTPFERMPLGWDRAYGGTADVRVDASARVPVTQPLNPLGRGIDHERWRGVLEDGGLREPGLTDERTPRLLPNVEHPDHLIRAWSDDPLPYSWAPLPVDIGLLTYLRVTASSEQRNTPRALQRSHPDLTVTPPEAGTVISLRGCSPDGQPFTFGMPGAGVVADSMVEGRIGALHLAPQLLVILPEESRFTLTYRGYFTMPFVDGDERSLRLRSL